MRLTGFEGRTAIVTGAAGGIGREIVRHLHEAGATVFATDTMAALEADPVPDVPNLVLDVRDGAAAGRSRSGPMASTPAA